MSDLQRTYSDYCHGDVNGVDAHHCERNGVFSDVGVDKDASRVEKHLQHYVRK